MQFPRGHPVADNPLRLLSVDPAQGWDLYELQERAARFATRAGVGAAGDLPQLAAEPAQAFCSRRRSGNDYAYASGELHDPLAFAEAVAFLPDDWVEPRHPIGQANWLLLKAEGLPAGDLRRVEWIGRALTLWDSKQCAVQLEAAVAEALRDFSPEALEAQSEPLTLESLNRSVDALLLTLADELLAEISCSIVEDPIASRAGAAWIDLLNHIDRFERLARPGATAAAEEWLVNRLLQYAEEFTELAEVLGLPACCSGELSVLDLPTPSPAQIHNLLAISRKVRAAAALASKRPSLATGLAAAQEELLLDAQQVLAAWAVGVRVGAWSEAAELLKCVNRDAVEQCNIEETRHAMRLACAVIPALAAVQNSGGADQRLVVAASNTLAGLRKEFPKLSAIIAQLERSVDPSRLGETVGQTAASKPAVSKPEIERSSDQASAAALPGVHAAVSGTDAAARSEAVPRLHSPARRPVPVVNLPKHWLERPNWKRSPYFWRTAAQATACLFVAAGFVWFFTGTSGGVGTSAEVAASATPTNRPEVVAATFGPGARTQEVASPDSEPGVGRYTDSRGKVYRVPLAVLGDLQTEARAIERKRLQVEEMRVSLEAYKSRLDAERRGRGASSQVSMENKVEGIRRERELVREQEKILQSMVEEHQDRLNRL